MTMLAPDLIEKAAFLDWVERQGGRGFELVRGRIVQDQSGGTVDHSWIAARVLVLLTVRTDQSIWAVLTGDLAIDVDPEGASIRFPEVSVIRVPVDGKVRSTSEPVVLVEVASASTKRTDFGDKRNEYLALPSLEAYVIASQEEPKLWCWTRPTMPDTGGLRPFPSEPAVLERRDDTVALAAVGFTCTLDDIYRGIL
jgi:Uma2 family endonuclease